MKVCSPDLSLFTIARLDLILDEESDYSQCEWPWLKGQNLLRPERCTCDEVRDFFLIASLGSKKSSTTTKKHPSVDQALNSRCHNGHICSVLSTVLQI